MSNMDPVFLHRLKIFGETAQTHRLLTTAAPETAEGRSHLMAAVKKKKMHFSKEINFSKQHLYLAGRTPPRNEP